MKKPFSSPSRASLLTVLGGALLIAGNVPIWAQTAPDGASAPVPGPAPAFSAPVNTNVQAVGPTFKLQAGDVLAVQVANHPEMSAATVAVAANGQLNLPVVGALTAQGKTIGQVSAAIQHAYSTQLKRPQVSVTLVSSVARQLVVRGAVGKPGPVDVRNDLRLSEVIAASGGLMVDGVAITGNEAQATLVRGKMAARPLDLGMALAVPQSPANLTLKAGDVINVTARPLVSVALAGDGVAPSVVKIRLSAAQPQVRVSDVLKAGGSLKSKPEQTKGFLLRHDQKTELDVNALFNGGNPNADLLLQSGDQLNFEIVETKKIDVSVVSFDGSVKTPGTYSFENDASALRTLVQAGGFASDIRPDQVAVSVQRGGRIIPVDVERAVLNPQYDVPLENKDVVFAAYNPAPRVRLLGSVTKPELYRLKENATILDAITTAGGLLLPPAQTTIRIVRTTSEGKQIGITVDATRLFGMTDLSQNVKLLDGDLVFIGESRRGRQVYISGEVTTPGALELGESDGLTELLLKAGGPKPSAALSKLSVTSRGGTQRYVDASSIVNGGKVAIPLEEGDYVNVPRNEATVTVMGAVAKPDNYTIPENQVLTIGNAILQAGGTAFNAKLQEVAVVHRLNDGTTKVEVVPLDKVPNGVLTIDYPLHDRDVVYVPQGRVSKSLLSKLTSTLGPIGLVARLGGF
ncbi:hypothetical protein IAD21_06261 [Abditibacteriota bacterium]|nr:hypothetical protein IAD21_06261 [Abditibacteriota bacterium]